jgi:hypothetical protein
MKQTKRDEKKIKRKDKIDKIYFNLFKGLLLNIISPI